MSLTSLTYVLFLTACAALYRLLPARWRRGALLCASVGFYLYAMPAQLPVMLVYVWAVYALGLGIVRRRRAAKPLLAFGICLSAAYLLLYKYLDPFLLSLSGGRASLGLAVPMGISYVTLQCVSYLVKVYRRQMRALANPVPLFLYALFFPKLTAGPIESPDAFRDEIRQKELPGWPDTLTSCVLIAVGFAKKCAAADLVAPAVNAVFARPGEADGLSTLAAMLLYSAQIYFDFSGYTDIALGSARLFGIRLTENFDRPYSAADAVDFWRRWHISLTGWLREYVYFPLGGSRVRTGRRYLNVMATFLFSGLWHGASLTYVIWGLLHGLFQIAELHLKKLFPRRGEPAGASLLLARLRTFALVTVAWVFFRADTLPGALRVLGGLFGRWASPAEAFRGAGVGAWAFALFALTALAADRIKRRVLANKLSGQASAACCAALAAAAFLGVVLGAGSGAGSSFIYFNF